MSDERRRRGGPAQKSRQRPAERARVGDPARRAAYTVLRAVADGAYANLELPTVLRAQRVSGRDAAFATELTYGTLRLQGRYDPIIAIAAGRALTAIDANVLDTLRLGCHQVLGMRVPAHAAVAETVALARQVNGAGAAGFVNAVLRRVSERTPQEWLDAITPEGSDAVTRLAITQSHPTWIVKALREALLGHGRSTRETVDADLGSLLAADNEAAAMSLVARPGLCTVEDLQRAGATPGRWARTAATLPGGDPGALAVVRDGRAAVQDEGSQLVALALAAVPVEGTGPQRWLDLCAGPGGKAGLLAALALEQGASLVANEVSEHRAELVRHTLRPALAAGSPGQVQVRVGDGREIGELEPAAYDKVLVDAPCTGLGALRRRPEARWRRTPDDLAVLTKLQRELLASALDATRPGGVVAYVTCSPHLSETVFAVRDVVKKRSDVELLDAGESLRDKDGHALAGSGSGLFAQLWPDVHGTDAMFLALLRKVAPSRS
ncbi:MAG: rRNA small subunit methyltransferase B [Actinomycetales bacterium]|uniref:rRNA small subunit methyltransferase B n=1 Tax=Candidatus Phosphoribacter hodrii TaxID=2953743 RepID=A0A935IMA7_9MICO|nr:rRNA small subunit methyltransferase B [Candidatus Phosphoribacter hodrii]